jgi:hypothetical protein
MATRASSKGKVAVPTTADKKLKLSDVLDGDTVLFKPNTFDELNQLIAFTQTQTEAPLSEAAVRIEPSNKQLAQLKKTDKFGQKIGDKVATDTNGPILVYLGLEKKAAWLMKSQHADEKGVLRVVRTSDIHQVRYSAAMHQSLRKSGGSKKARKVISSGIGKIS